MKSQVEKYCRMAEDIERKIKVAFDNMDVIASESERVATIDISSSWQEAELEFEKITGLDKSDILFLFFATALQTLRWLFADRIGKGFDPETRLKEDDKTIKDAIKKSNDDYQKSHGDWDNGESSKGYKDWQNIIFSKPPYDTIKGSAQFGLGLNGQNHRYKTLGHDPLLGWFFGTVNIMTDTATMNDLKTFDIENGEFVRRTTLYKAINDCISSAREDWHRVPAAVFAEGVHLKSDDFTKIGLPIPTLSFFNEKLAEQLCKFHYDKLCMQKDLKNIGKQIEISCFINLIVSAFHSLFYDPEKEDIKLYEVKTRKIMMYSNLIASTSNILYTVIATTCFKSKTAYQKIDIGGLIVTMYRLISDSEFILRIKREFIVNKINKKIQGCLLNLEEIL